MNYKSFTHTAGRFKFFAPRCDFQSGIFMQTPKSYTATELAAAVAEMIGYHATAIWPELNGFSGYDSISWTIRNPISDEDFQS